MEIPMTSQQKALEQLQTIKTFFEEGQKNLYDNGFLFMFWGLLIPIATGLFYWLVGRYGYDKIFVKLFWPSVSLMGTVLSWISGYTSGKKSKVKGYAHKINSLMWAGFLISILVLTLVQLISRIDIHPMFLSYISLFLGLAYWIHGSMIQLLWFRYVSVVWWLTALAVASMDWFMASMVLSLATFICSFGSGLLLFRSRRKNT